jgi:hypothetical protein
MGNVAQMLNCLFLGCNKKQIPYLLNLLSKGYNVLVFDRDAAPTKAQNYEFVPIAYSDIDAIIHHLHKTNTEIDLLFSAGDQASQLCLAQIAKRIAKPFLSTKVAERILDKSKFYKDFSEHDIKIPSTEYVSTVTQYQQIVRKMLTEHNKIYVKSDLSKNPRYIYTAQMGKIPTINWKSDRYFQKYYILQPEVVGDNVRIDIMGEDIFLFDFFSGELLSDTARYKNQLDSLLVKYKKLIKNYGINRYIVKFDAIFDGDEFYTLDIGIDPPQRLIKYLNDEGEDFYDLYFEHYCP